MASQRFPRLGVRIAVALASAAFAPDSALAKSRKPGHDQQVMELAAENAQLRQQLAEMRRERDLLKAANPQNAQAAAEAAVPKTGGNPFSVKDLDKPYNIAKAEPGQASGSAQEPSKDKKEMACGAQMMKSGEMACGAKMMKKGEMRCGANMIADMPAMEPGSQMQMNPVLAGTDFYHIHPKGMWMFNTSYMHVNQNGLASGSANVPLTQVLPDHLGTPNSKPPYNYMMAPTYMTMDMFMFMPMVGITDRLTVMAMVNYMSMEMGMKMGMGNAKPKDWVDMAPMTTSGFYDSELDAVYAITKEIFGTLGLSIPTGSITRKVEMMGVTYRAPYDMQLGSGTFAIKPSLSYHHVTDDALWMWGGQATFTGQIKDNSYGYTRGNNFKTTVFLQRAFGAATGFLQMTFNDTGKIRGYDPNIAIINRSMLDGGASTPDADPHNYGGQRLDALMGLAYEKGPFSFGVSGGVPVYQYLNGLQLKTTWILNSAFQAMF